MTEPVDTHVEDAMLRAPRSAFLPPEAQGEAGVDAPLPIGEGQTISAPHMVAIMSGALDVRPGHRVLEVGAGSGWHAAVLALLAAPGGSVVAVERHAALARQARRNLAPFGLPVEVVVGDGSEGWPARAPYDRISVAAGAPRVPPPLVDQLAPGGVLVLPVGPLDMQSLLRVTMQPDGDAASEDLGPVRFVPLIGRFGHTDQRA